jgi:hypothetical protein
MTHTNRELGPLQRTAHDLMAKARAGVAGVPNP